MKPISSRHASTSTCSCTSSSPHRAVLPLNYLLRGRSLPRSPPLPCSLANLQSSCLSALATTRMPTTRNEEYRFTDISPVLQQSLGPAAPADAASIDEACAALGLKATPAATVVVVDGAIDEQRSSMSGLPEGVYVGGLAGAPQDVVSFALVRGFRG